MGETPFEGSAERRLPGWYYDLQRGYRTLVSPKAGRRVHLILLIVWVVVGLPVSFVLRQSVPWLVFLSVYAIVVGHWSGWSAERPSEVVNE